MSEPLNANPVVLDVSQLPKRHEQMYGSAEKSLEAEEERLIYKNLHTLSLLDVGDDDEDDDESIFDIENLSLPSLSDNEDVEMKSPKPRTRSSLEPIDAQEIYDLVAPISDPEHPLTLGQLAVVNLNDIKITLPTERNKIGEVLIYITPTITHCSLATLIGLGIRVRLERCLPNRFRIVILLKAGTHQSENQVNKQLNDKERVSAACENPQLLRVISHMLSTCN